MNVIYYTKKDGSNPVKEYIDSQDKKMIAKILMSIALLQEYGIKVPRLYSKYIEDGIFELRNIHSNDITRILYFFVEDDTAVLTNGFVKKTMKTPRREIELAKARRNDYKERNAI